MKLYAVCYWFTWAFLVLAAALTGVASLRDTFFGGLFAALFAALFVTSYIRVGQRYAPLLGAFAGVFWVIIMYMRINWIGTPSQLELAKWTLGTDISVHAAGFAGAALLVALYVNHSFLYSLIGGLTLSFAMTAVPYGVIAWIDYHIAGPVEVVLLTNAEVNSESGPVRSLGAVRAEFRLDEIKFLKEHILIIDGPDSYEVIDQDALRYWPLWRRKFFYPGNPNGPIRRIFVLLPSKLMQQTWKIPLPEPPNGIGLTILGENSVRYMGGIPSKNISLELSLSLTVTKSGNSNKVLNGVVFRNSPIGNLYVPVRTSEISAEFTAKEEAPAIKNAQTVRLPMFTPESTRK